MDKHMTPAETLAALEAGLLPEHVSRITRFIDGEWVTTQTPDPGYVVLPCGGVKSIKAIRREARRAAEA
jgi:hypothetical protein